MGLSRMISLKLSKLRDGPLILISSSNGAKRESLVVLIPMHKEPL